MTKITASVVKVIDQLFTPYGRSLVIPKRVIRQPRPPSLLDNLVPHVVVSALEPTGTTVMSDSSDVEVMPHTAPIVPSNYGYSTDSLREITTCMSGPREIRRNHISYIRSSAITEEQGVTYMLDIPENISGCI